VDPVLRRGWVLVAVLWLATALAWVVEGGPLAQVRALPLPLAQVRALPLPLAQVSPLVESALAVLLFG